MAGNNLAPVLRHNWQALFQGPTAVEDGPPKRIAAVLEDLRPNRRRRRELIHRIAQMPQGRHDHLIGPKVADQQDGTVAFRQGRVQVRPPLDGTDLVDGLRPHRRVSKHLDLVEHRGMISLAHKVFRRARQSLIAK
jgi:hypothetical protein